LDTENCIITLEIPDLTRLEWVLGRRKWGEERHSPRIRNAPLTTHIMAAITTTAVFFFQIAILASNISVHFRESIEL
jgi:hypothetical protein